MLSFCFLEGLHDLSYLLLVLSSHAVLSLSFLYYVFMSCHASSFLHGGPKGHSFLFNVNLHMETIKAMLTIFWRCINRVIGGMKFLALMETIQTPKQKLNKWNMSWDNLF